MNIPFIVINWCAMNIYDDPIKEIIIKKSLLFKYLKSCLIFCKPIKININNGICINLNLRNILENSKGNKKYSTLVFPILSGKSIYCS